MLLNQTVFNLLHLKKDDEAEQLPFPIRVGKLSFTDKDELVRICSSELKLLFITNSEALNSIILDDIIIQLNNNYTELIKQIENVLDVTPRDVCKLMPEMYQQFDPQSSMYRIINHFLKEFINAFIKLRVNDASDITSYKYRHNQLSSLVLDDVMDETRSYLNTDNTDYWSMTFNELCKLEHYKDANIIEFKRIWNCPQVVNKLNYKE